MRNKKQTVAGATKSVAVGVKPGTRNRKKTSADETAYLNSTSENRAALARSLKESATGQTVKIDL